METLLFKIFLFSLLSFTISNIRNSEENNVDSKRVHSLNTLKDNLYVGNNNRDRLKENVLTTTKINQDVTGVILESYSGRDIFAYQGIPYTEENLKRFKRSNVRTSYSKKINATQMGSSCLQASWDLDRNETVAVGKDDCLFMNVYTPIKKPSGFRQNDLLPVMVFIHGGQFVSGDATPYMPMRLLDKDVILVTFHYRLGALSFYTFGSSGIEFPGNLALYDQNSALEWVNMYIEDFGGDKDRVTLFGQDAGATSALYHLITGKSVSQNTKRKEGLFKGVIAMSGTPIDPFGYNPHPKNTSADLAAQCDCEHNNIQCMTDVDDKIIALAAYELAKTRHVQYPILAPGIEENTDGFLSKAPMDLILEANYEKLPLLIGTCAQEGSYVFGELFSNYLAREKKDKDEEYLEYSMVPDMVDLAGINDPLEFVSSSLYETYLKGVDRTIFSEIINGMIDMTGSLFSKAGVLEIAKLSYENYLGKSTTEPNVADIFLYSFEYKGEDSMFSYHFSGVDEKPVFTDKQIGVTRGDDIMYLFSTSSLEKKDEETMKAMVEMFTNFAIYDNPTIEGSVQWKTYSNQNQEYLSIGDRIQLMVDYEERYTILVDEEGDSSVTPDITHSPPGSLPNIPLPTGMLPNVSVPTLPANPTLPPHTTAQPPDLDKTCSCIELNDANADSEAYMITMIIFIILFVIAIGLAIYMYFKSAR